MQSIVLSAEGLKKTIGNSTIIHDFSFELNKGEIVGLLGPNGSGKTTILKMLVGLLKPTKGKIMIGGHDIQKEFESAIIHVGAVVENPEMYGYLSGYDNLVHFLRMSRGTSLERIDEVINLLHMQDYVNDKVNTYSLGMKQRLGLAQAILHSPSVLILDEPTNGLDPEGMKDLRVLLKKLAKEQQVAVVISSHILAEIEILCDSVVVIREGHIIDKSEINRQQENGQERVSYFFKVLEVESAAAFLSDIDLQEEIQFQDTGFMVELNEWEVADLNKRLIQNDISVVGIRRVEHTLEDKFLNTLKGITK